MIGPCRSRGSSGALPRRELRRSTRSTPVRLLRRILDWGSPLVPATGRRFGTEAEPTRGNSCFCVIFSPPELVELRQEVEAAINVAIRWTEPEWLAEDTEQNLLAYRSAILSLMPLQN